MPSADRIESAAARWVARREAAPLEPQEQIEFEAWCAQDPRHFGAVVRLEAINVKLERAVALQGLEPETRVARPRWQSAAAAAALVACVVTSWQLVPVKQPQAERRTLATGLGEQYRATLGDGSLVELNTATRLAVDLAPEERRVVLASGEAVFDVAKDPERPFIVETKLASVRAVGTTFSVRIDRGLEVLVSEGVVIVDRDGQPLARVGAGERYSVAASGGAHTKAEPPDEIGRALVWREGKVAFAGETVLEAALELNRYNKVKIEVRDPAVGAMRLGGYFRATDPEGFATAMEQALPVDAHREGETITLSAR